MKEIMYLLFELIHAIETTMEVPAIKSEVNREKISRLNTIISIIISIGFGIILIAVILLSMNHRGYFDSCLTKPVRSNNRKGKENNY